MTVLYYQTQPSTPVCSFFSLPLKLEIFKKNLCTVSLMYFCCQYCVMEGLFCAGLVLLRLELHQGFH